MTENHTNSADSGTKTRPPALSAMRLPQLQELAREMSIPGVDKMRKTDLLAAIREKRSGSKSAPAKADSAAKANGSARSTSESAKDTAQASDSKSDSSSTKGSSAEDTSSATSDSASNSRGSNNGSGSSDNSSGSQPSSDKRGNDGQRSDSDEDGASRRRTRRRSSENGGDDSETANGNNSHGGNSQGNGGHNNNRRGNRDESGERKDGGDRHRENKNNRRGNRDDKSGNRADSNRSENNKSDSGDNEGDSRGNRRTRGRDRNAEEERRNRRGRGRDRKRRGGRGNDMEDEPQVHEDDVLVPVAGILDVLDNYAFVRTSGYLAGPNDVYVSLGQVKRNGLRKGDAVTGAVKQQKEGDQGNSRQKYNPLVRLDTINGIPVEETKKRVEFGKLTPLYPQERLRLEHEASEYTTRIIDLVAPIGKGQRGLIVSPPKAGKTLILQSIAKAITVNNPECHLMVVLVDERPEEVTDMQRTVQGEVIASTFDRPADDHTTVAELAIERAKRLVEMGMDVVVLLDSITRLGRAYNLAAPASGRILSGGVDSSALYPPKRFFGAARNIENGGSLTILATALVDTGSKMDEVIFEEFKGTGNMELRLDRRLADKRLFPAVDVNPSGTRREEILLGAEELGIMWKLRRVLTALDSQEAMQLLLSKLKETKSNGEFLMHIQKTAPSGDRSE